MTTKFVPHTAMTASASSPSRRVSGFGGMSVVLEVERRRRSQSWLCGSGRFDPYLALGAPSTKWRGFSWIIDSARRDWTANNVDGFLRSLIAVAGITAP